MFFRQHGEMAIGGASVSAALASRAQTLGANGTPFSLTGTLTETLLTSVKIPAGAPGTKGVIRVEHFWTYTNNANSKTGRIRWGATAGTGGGAIISNPATTTAAYMDVRTIFFQAANASKAQSVAAPYGQGATSNVFAVDTSVDTFLSFTGTLANVADTITLEGYLVQLFPFV